MQAFSIYNLAHSAAIHVKAKPPTTKNEQLAEGTENGYCFKNKEFLFKICTLAVLDRMQFPTKDTVIHHRNNFYKH